MKIEFENGSSIEPIDNSDCVRGNRAKKTDYHLLGCNLDDDSGGNDCWSCTQFVFPIGCMVGKEVDERGQTNQ